MPALNSESSVLKRRVECAMLVAHAGGEAMNDMTKIEIPVEKATATALTDNRRLAAIGRLVDRLVQPGSDDPLVALFERTSSEARNFDISDEEIQAELAAYNAERRV